MSASQAEEKASINPILRAAGLVREYGAVVAVAGINLSLARGEFLTIVGPNGAGKTSLLGLLAGALRPTRGHVWLRGEVLDFGEVEWRRRIGVLSHQGFLYGHLTAEENLRSSKAIGSPLTNHGAPPAYVPAKLRTGCSARIGTLSGPIKVSPWGVKRT